MLNFKMFVGFHAVISLQFLGFLVFLLYVLRVKMYLQCLKYLEVFFSFFTVSSCKRFFQLPQFVHLDARWVG
jgi:hypothetical protein